MSQETEELLAMLAYKRPAGGKTEQEYREKFLLPLGVQPDKHGNLIYTIGESPTVLWSSHTDTVHRGEGKQLIELDGDYIRLKAKSKSSCLGADDAAGNWVMMEMIRASVPGVYVFHYGEERGGIGSNALLKDNHVLLDGIQAAIAFDRKGTSSVITHQGVRTCSDAFGRSLAVQLGDGYKLDDSGTFTDTKVYKNVVPECTNVSVGYVGQHTASEKQDVGHLIKLRDAMLAIDPSQFVIERDPKAQFSGALSGLGGLGGLRNELWDEPVRRRPVPSLRRRDDQDELATLLFDYPDDAAAVLRYAGLDVEDFQLLVADQRDIRENARMQLAGILGGGRYAA